MTIKVDPSFALYAMPSPLKVVLSYARPKNCLKNGALYQVVVFLHFSTTVYHDDNTDACVTMRPLFLIKVGHF